MSIILFFYFSLKKRQNKWTIDWQRRRFCSKKTHQLIFHHHYFYRNWHSRKTKTQFQKKIKRIATMKKDRKRKKIKKKYFERLSKNCLWFVFFWKFIANLNELNSKIILFHYRWKFEEKGFDFFKYFDIFELNQRYLRNSL